MLHFWMEVLLRASLDTLAGIGKDPAELRFSIFVFVLVTVFLLIRNRKKGLRAWVENVKQRFWRIVGEDIAIILGLIVLILIYNVLREPYLAWDSERNGLAQENGKLNTKVSEFNECNANLRTERVKSQLLGNQVTAQQTQISRQQTTSSTQQSTFDLCVTTLAKANAPVQQAATILFAPVPTSSSTPTKHTGMMVVLTNKQQTPARLLVGCDGPIDTLTVLSFGGELPFQGSAVPIGNNPLAGFFAKTWLLNVSQPEWAPSQPLLLKIDYNADDLGQCFVR